MYTLQDKRTIPLFSSKIINNFYKIKNGDIMKVKIFDEGHEKDLENAINDFIKENEPEIIDIHYAVSMGIFQEEQIYCFSALIIYR